MLKILGHSYLEQNNTRAQLFSAKNTRASYLVLKLLGHSYLEQNNTGAQLFSAINTRAQLFSANHSTEIRGEHMKKV